MSNPDFDTVPAGVITSIQEAADTLEAGENTKIDVDYPTWQNDSFREWLRSLKFEQGLEYSYGASTNTLTLVRPHQTR